MRPALPLLLLAIASCSTTTPPTPPEPAAPPPFTATASACESDTVLTNLIAAVESVPDVADAQVVGQCARLVVSTRLPERGSSDKAKAVCEATGALAYRAGVGSVSVEAGDRAEIAVGIEGAPCLAQP